MTTLTSADPAALLAHTTPLWQLYRECFAGPPWSEPEDKLADFPAQLQRQTSSPGAGGLLAYDGGTLVGAVYGWPAPPTLPRTTVFDQAVADAVPPEALPRLIAPSLVVAELMVAASHRRQGIAGRLLTAYVADAPTAWLVTHRDGGAPDFYRRHGWRQDAAFTSLGEPVLLFTWAARAVQEGTTQNGSTQQPGRPPRRRTAHRRRPPFYNQAMPTPLSRPPTARPTGSANPGDSQAPDGR